MVAKRSVRKQQDTSHSLQQMVTTLSALADALQGTISRCIVDAGEDAVHQLRTGSRRLQALLEAALRSNDPQLATLAKPARGWLRGLKKIRQAAGPVRDLDVHRHLLREKMATSPDGPLQAQIAALDAWLRRRRDRSARGMQKQLEKHRHRLMERQRKVFAALASLATQRVEVLRSTEAAALELFVHAANAMPCLHAANLHDFRKAMKKARYLAEAGVQEQKYSNVARALKRVQDAIGKWHDWQCLVGEARKLKTETPRLTAQLEREANQHLAIALETTETIRGQLLGEWVANAGKVPVRQAVVSFATGSRKKQA